MKERNDDGAEYHGSTFFVSNLPYNATSTDLQTLFSEIAPVRNAFVVCESGTGMSKGVGYVSFAIREDAQAAFDQIAKEGLTLVGRKLRIQWAEQKAKTKKEKMDPDQKEPPQKKPRQQSRANNPQDPLAIRTVIVSGLPSSIDSKSLWKKIRKHKGAEKLEWPVSGDDGIQDSSSGAIHGVFSRLSCLKPRAAHAIFSTPALALDAVNKLHAHVFKGSLLSVTLKKRIETLSSQKASTKAPNHANRLIIRNLPFTSTEQDLRSIFLRYGPIYSINMPLNVSPSSGGSKETVKTEEDVEQLDSIPTNKGFAFIWFYSRKDAEKAMEGINGTVVRAGAAEELVKSKQKKKKERRVERKLAAQKDRESTMKREESDVEGDKEEEERENDTRKSERVAAVDWALSKDRWEEERAKMESESEESNAGSSSSDGECQYEEGEEESGWDAHDQEASGDDETSSDQSEDERDEDDKPIKPQLPQTDVGTTLFIRNIPYDATEDELRILFHTFGPLRYVRITMDPATGRSRGTGFACFWNKEDADKLIQQSQLLKAETTGSDVVFLAYYPLTSCLISLLPCQLRKKNPFTLPSILTPDPSSSLAQNLVLHGRALDVIRAVTRGEAGRLKELGERAREKADKRNMYLLREGVILPNSPSAATIPPTDLERRTNSFNARRALLKSNPSLYISKTRLSIRQIPLFVTERMLKRLAIHAVRTFEKEVKEGKRNGLSEEESRDPGGRPGERNALREETRDEAGNESDAGSVASFLSTSATRSAKRKTKFLKKLTRSQRNGGSVSSVKQAKIVRQAERVDPITGKGRSRGYGFIEMHTHADALRVLRWVNANAELGVLLGSQWKEELERLIKLERDRLKGSEGKGDEERSDVRLKRMVAELTKEKEGKQEQDDEKKRRGTLIVEFSIENVQVVQRRKAVQNKATVSEPSSPHAKKRARLPDKESSAPLKKQRIV
ncbi:RNA-binding domain-containing protein [Amanita rubescens]|nr:RNA-binding domain-containing protein [Amanita rubescens]